jgi:kinesin family protein 5
VQLVDQNSTLKKEVAVAEKKLLARNDRIQNLEAALNNADLRLAQKTQKHEAQLQAMQLRLQDSEYCIQCAWNETLILPVQQRQGAAYSAGRIAKPLRGGGGGGGRGEGDPTDVYQAIAAGNPVGRVPEEGHNRRREYSITLLRSEAS